MNLYIIKENLNNFLEKIIDSKSRIFLFICSAFIIGISLSSFLIKTQKFSIYFFTSAVIFLVFVIEFWKNKKVRFLLLCGLFLFLGFWRYSLSLSNNSENEIIFFNNKDINIIGQIIEEPDERENHTKLIINVENLTFEREIKDVSGKVLAKVPLFPKYNYGDVLNLNCELEEPGVYEDFDYKKYLERDEIYSLCNYPKNIKVLENNGSKFFSIILKTKEKFSEKLNEIFPEPHASFLAGILYGERRGIPPDIKEDFSKTGVTHIIAISGYNIIIVITVFFGFLYYLRIPRKFAFWVALCGIFIFVILTGAEASVVRAAIMGFVALSAKQIGRPNETSNALILTGALMLLEDPKLLRFDIGFQLSFVATLGLVYISPIINKKLGKTFLFDEEIRKAFIETSSAIIATLPLLIYYFGNISIVALPTNIAILLFIPTIMLFGFLGVLFGFIYLPLGQIIGFVAWIILTYVLKVINFFAEFPFAQINLGKAPFLFLITSYGVLTYWIYKKKKAEGPERDEQSEASRREVEEFEIVDRS